MSDIQSGFEPPVANVPPVKKGKKVWIFAGVGCLLVSLLCVAGIGVSLYMASGVIASVFSEITTATDAIQNSQQVQAELGTPLTVEAAGQPQQNGQSLSVDGIVKGPEGSGTFSISLSTDGKTFTTESITVEANGKTIVIGDEIEEIEEELGDLESELEGLE
jgi:hypothetical protein